MSHVTYAVLDELHRVGGESRTSYGLAVYSDVATDGSACLVASFHDLSSSRPPLEALAERCNRLRPSLDHLPNIISDFLG